MLFRPKPPECVRALQRTFQELLVFEPSAARKWLRDTIDTEAWRECRDEHGTPHPTFHAWAIARQPFGLGIASQEAAEAQRDLLLANGDVSYWGETLQQITRPPGKPAKRADGGDDQRFYRVTTAATGKDRLLLRLMRHHPQEYTRLCAGELNSIRHAARVAGLISPRVGGPWQTMRAILEAFRRVSKDEQVDFILELLNHLEEDAKESLRDLLREWPKLSER